RVEIGCDTVDSDDFDSYMEGEVAGGFPAFDTVEGECQAGDDSVSIAAAVPHDVKGEGCLEAMGGRASAGYAGQSGKLVVLVDGTAEGALAFADAAQEGLGGKVVHFSAAGVEKV